MTSTPAPTLEELPPEKGTILELHSINSDYDGTLVEFIKLENDTGRFFVIPFEQEGCGAAYLGGDGTEEFMRVKTKCCRRPDLKPIKLRKLLLDLAQKLDKDKGLSHSARESKIKSLLKKDPCCVPVYQWLASQYQFYSENLITRNTFLAVDALFLSIRYHTILLANRHVYGWIFTDKMAIFYRRGLADLLSKAGRKAASLRILQENTVLGDTVRLSLLERANHELAMGRKQMQRGDYFMMEKQFSKEINKKVKAVEHFLNALEFVGDMENIHAPSDDPWKNDSFEETGDDVAVSCIQFLRQVLDHFGECISTNGCEAKAGGMETDEGLVLSDRIILTVDHIFEVCSKEGSKFEIYPHYFEAFTQHKDFAKQIKAEIQGDEE